MRRIHSLALTVLLACGMAVPWATAQDEPESDTLQPALEDTMSVQVPAEIAPSDVSTAAAVKRANTWLRRLLYRGVLDVTHIGAYAEYQLTSWSESTGSYGPVDARLTVSYLGSTRWLGADAEWLQAVYRAVDEEAVVIEYDVIVPSSSTIDDIHRVVYRVDRGEIKAADFSISASEVDYDRSDRPVSEGAEALKLYTGTYLTEKLRGSGTDGAEVVIYRVADLPPLGIVRLGYGEEGLTFVAGGDDAVPRMNVPPPPSR